MTDKASERVELINDIANFIDHKRTPELLFHPRPYPSSGAERLPQHYKQMGQLADFILAREQSLKQEHERALDLIEKTVCEARNEIVDEISNHPNSANIGKKGCVTRLNGRVLETINRLRGNANRNNTCSTNGKGCAI